MYICTYIHTHTHTFFPRIRRRVHARASRTHARTHSLTHSRTRSSSSVVELYAYSFVHIRSRERAHSTASVCASVAFSFLFLAVRSAATGLHYSHDHRHSVVACALRACRVRFVAVVVFVRVRSLCKRAKPRALVCVFDSKDQRRVTSSRVLCESSSRPFLCCLFFM